jgi:hypothetical protein
MRDMPWVALQRGFYCAAVFLVPALVAACDLRVTPQFVAGPEAGGVAEHAAGYIVIRQGWDSAEPDPPRIIAVSMPEATQRVVRPGNRGNEPAVWSVSGPDAEGRIAFVEYTNVISRWHRLKTIELDGNAEQTLFERPGSALSDDAIGEHIALAPVGGRVAIVAGKLAHVQMRQPSALLTVGALEIWDLAKRTAHQPGITILQDSLSWFPDGRRLAVSILMPRGELDHAARERLEGDPSYGPRYRSWDQVPTVFLIDAVTGERRFLHVGARPLVSVDGASVLVRAGRWRLVDVARGDSQLVRWPGNWVGPIALLPGGKVLYAGLPTEGTEPRWIKRGSFRVGSQMGAVKLADLSTQRFVTVVPYIDPRDRVSFGVGPSASSRP